MKFDAYKRYSHKPRIIVRIVQILVVLLVVVGVALVGLFIWFNNALQAPLLEPEPVEIVVSEGETVDQIANNLEAQGVIRSSMAFQLYAQLYGRDDTVQAGSYTFDKTESSKKILARLISGDVSQTYITIVPGARLDQIRQVLLAHGYSEQAVATALDPNSHLDHPLVAEYLPDGASLEGYLYPETYATTNSTQASEIVDLALSEMYAALTPQIVTGFASQNVSVHDAIILASLVEKEVSSPDEKPFVAQVFLTRLSIGMALESNATDDYPASYNTYEIPGLPPSPLSTVGDTSLLAVAEPATTDYLFFVTGNDCVTRFSRTIGEHEELQRVHGVGCKQ